MPQYINERNSIQMSKYIHRGITSPADRSGDEILSLLLKMQRQLLFLEKKIDSLMHHFQDKKYRENSSDKPFSKKSSSKPLPISRSTRSSENKKHREKPAENGSDKTFYSRFLKTNGNPGSNSRKKPFHHKTKKRK